ncbi:MAG: flippase-like domain-containing protein [Candidatus Omnitrophica bacterium]|nr:flippase-like domain-containing protein [Candidatus Omnitrophota bacterium]
MKNKLFLFVRIAISFTLIGLILWLLRDKLPDIVETIANADRGFLLLGFFTFLFAVLAIGIRLQKVISVQGIHLSAKEALYLTFIGYFFNNFLPTSIGGDLVKAYYAGKKVDKKAAAFAGVFMDRFLAMIPFTLIPAVTLLFYSHRIDSKPMIALIYILFFSCIGLLWLLMHKNTVKYLAFILEPFKEKLWQKRLRQGYGFLHIYSKHKMILLWSFGLSVLTQMTMAVSVFLFSKAVGITGVGLGIFFIVVPIVGVMSLIPSLNGLGIREGAFVYMLKSYMLPEQAFAISILFLASLITFGIIGGIIYALKKNLFTFNMGDLK